MLFAAAYGYYLKRLSNPNDPLAQTSSLDSMAKSQASGDLELHHRRACLA
ncbi:hypothetical protein [Bradyrhizobium sp. RDI18]